jgi:hypothetical protein
MKLNIDILMTALLIVFLASFAVMLAYSEIWQLNLSTESSGGPLDLLRARIAFAASCVGIAIGAIMLYLMSTKYAQNEKKQDALPTPTHE